MDDFVVIGESNGEAYVEKVEIRVQMKEPIVLRYDVPLTLQPVQEVMTLAPPPVTVDLPAEWQRHPPRFYWLNRFNSRCGCLLDESCVEPHPCYQKIWIEKSCRWPLKRYRGPQQHVL